MDSYITKLLSINPELIVVLLICSEQAIHQYPNPHNKYNRRARRVLDNLGNKECWTGISENTKAIIRTKLNLQRKNIRQDMQSHTFHKQDTVFYHIPSIDSTYKVAAFDMDMTLTYAENHVFPRDEDDVYILPGRKENLQELIDEGWTIAIFTNQFAKSGKEKEKRVKRVQTCIEKLGIPCFAFIATEKDKYRKPEIGMWEMFCEYVPVEEAIFVGDALGRPQDFSDSDKLFAENIGIECISPEDFFPLPPIIHTPGKNMTLFVGMPGCGKSKYYSEHLLPLGYTHISQDVLKTKAKVMKETRRAMKEGEDICIDNTNPTQEGREEFYALAQENGYTITVVYFVRDGRGWNELRKEAGERVPTMVYHLYFKKLVGPTAENTPGEVYLLA